MERGREGEGERERGGGREGERGRERGGGREGEGEGRREEIYDEIKGYLSWELVLWPIRWLARVGCHSV